ncbi:hypothetical protein VPNG_01771 [Cytospora leucostoma]|uniref:RRM domain-containing protein n=1 Tax=Cytospora leucostoma TaxID=1230097 RepID=A0A423XJA8_9PEZI|nr:hypothetical protein VPNG_01771 [Cytospora leucostoma]
MSYPGPPGVSSNASHSSLPPRPPAPNTGGGFRSTFPPATSAAPIYPASAPYSSAPTYNTPPVAAPNYGAAASTYSYPQAPPVGAGRGAYGQAATSYSYPTSYAQQPSYYGAATTASYSTPPQIRNPFPQPGATTQAQAPPQSQNPFDRSDPNYDPETAAQIAQWQSAYLPKEGADAGAAAAPKASGGKPGTATGPTFNAEAAAKAAQEGTANNTGEKKKTVYREGGGKKWADDSLLEWDPSHLRLFVGNLAGETTDDSLLKAFSRWQSVQKAKVVRDKRTNKSKGYGFVSFSDSDDFFQAAKEMNGKYIQSHPVVVRKSTTEIKPAAAKDKNKGKYQKKGFNKSGSGTGSGAGKNEAGYSPHLGPTGGGVVKPGQKNKSGVKFLG